MFGTVKNEAKTKYKITFKITAIVVSFEKRKIGYLVHYNNLM